VIKYTDQEHIFFCVWCSFKYRNEFNILIKLEKEYLGVKCIPSRKIEALQIEPHLVENWLLITCFSSAVKKREYRMNCKSGKISW
jgi:hypothetical protein